MIKQKKIGVGPFEFDCRISGDERNEPVFLLHGFPETSAMWTNLMESLSREGYFCIAPDLRGYSKDACPKGVNNYTVDKLSSDILNIADALGIAEFHLVAHDWVAAIGWYLVFNDPNRVISWTALSVPHTKAFAKAYRTDPVQKKKSRYIGFFLLPLIPEIRIRMNDFKGFRRLWKNSTEEEIEQYLTVFRRRPCLTGALNYYRANLKKGKRKPVGEIETPTLFIWGKKDLAIGEAAAKGTDQYMKGEYTFLELEGGHWLIQTNFEQVESAIIDHLSKHRKITK